MKKSLLVLIAVVALTMVVMVAPAAAHESREVGDYILVFGWWSEPAVVDEPNGPEIFVYARNADGTRGDRVEGAEFTVEASFGDATVSREFEPAFRDPGHWEALIFPTVTGDYSFHVVGTIGDLAVDEVFSSADGSFSSVEPKSDLQFPTSHPTMLELVQMITDLQAQVAELQAQLAELSE
jgi:hypothetical protein